MATPAKSIPYICRACRATRGPNDARLSRLARAQLRQLSSFAAPTPSSAILLSRQWPSPSSTQSRAFRTSPARRRPESIAGSNNAGEKPPEGAPTTDFSRMDMLSNTPPPSTSIDTCMSDGFLLNSGLMVDGGDGVMLVGGEAFAWRPWGSGKKLVNAKGQWEVGDEAFGLLEVLWPRPDLLILGLGPELRPLSPRTRNRISSLGLRIDVLDTGNAASQFNLLATERGVDEVAVAMIPIGWQEGTGAVAN